MGSNKGERKAAKSSMFSDIKSSPQGFCFSLFLAVPVAVDVVSSVWSISADVLRACACVCV